MVASRTSTARRRSCRRPASCCRASPAWGVGQLRPGQPQRQPADVRRAARQPRLRAQRPGELGRGLPARGAPGHDGPARREEPHRRPVPARRGEVDARRATPAGLDLLEKLNRKHSDDRAGRHAPRRPHRAATSWPPACSSSAPEVLDLSKETRGDADGCTALGRQGSTRGLRPQLPDRAAAAGARRAVRAGLERRRQRLPAPQLGLHEDLARDHGELGRGLDRPAAALIKDSKQRGLLDDTIVLWTTEFGRMPCSQGGKGRDHNPFAFTNWLAGGGIKGGVTYGASDEWSFRAADEADVLLRRPRDGAAPAGHRPHEADVPPQRHRPAADRRARARDRRRSWRER